VEPAKLIQGRPIGPDELALIRGWLAAHSSGHRTALSRELCSLWGWRNEIYLKAVLGDFRRRLVA
jgi:hypothetical protein